MPRYFRRHLSVLGKDLRGTFVGDVAGTTVNLRSLLDAGNGLITVDTDLMLQGRLAAFAERGILEEVAAGVPGDDFGRLVQQQVPGLVHHWPLDDCPPGGVGGPARERVTGQTFGSGYGILPVPTTRIATRLEGATSFPGNVASSVVDLGDTDAFAGTVPFTVLCWIRADSAIAGSRFVVTKRGNTPTGNTVAQEGWHLSVTATGIAAGRRSASTDVTSNVGATINAGDSVMCGMTYDGALVKGARGVFSNNSAALQAGTADVRTVGPTDAPLTIGRQSLVSTNAQPIDMSISDVMTFSRALTLAELQLILNYGRAVSDR